LALFAAGFALLGALGREEGATGAADAADAAGVVGATGVAGTTGAADVPEAISTTDYLLFNGAEPGNDPLSLTGAIPGLELTGVSKDGSIVGYASDGTVTELCLSLKDALGRDGWTLDDDNGQGVLSFCRDGQGGGAEAALLAQCLPVGQESSLVIKRW
jgi:hypothetical protein